MKDLSLWEKAKAFIERCYIELGQPESIAARLEEIQSDIELKGYYEHTFQELEHGAKMAWRNSNRCIGRLFWDTLHVFDARDAVNEVDMAEALFRHLKYATNDGRILSTITVFKPAEAVDQPLRIWNHQLLRYAGYETEFGLMGDPASIAFTQVCQELGWRGKETHFDLLPLVVQAGGGKPAWFDIPPDIVKEVPIRHPHIAAFEDLNLRWYAVPMITDMRLEIGGLNYTAAPFNGWYMGTEVGARNLADEGRYNMLPRVASIMGLDMSHESTLWKDRALIELNAAVLHSFKEAGVSVVDHHTAAHQFAQFEKKEQRSERPVTGDWTWLIPPVSPATTHIFHKAYEDRIETPNYFNQQKPYPTDPR